MDTFLVHYRLLHDRLDTALKLLEGCGLSVEVVKSWDGDVINAALISESSVHHWRDRIKTIAPLLLANALMAAKQAKNYKDALLISNKWLLRAKAYPTWMEPRSLKAGEVSVLLKHFYALSRIANGRNSFGLVAEDDILPRTQSKESLQSALCSAKELGYDYIDIVGGAGLTVDSDPDAAQVRDNISTIIPARTRTNACYIVSRSYAQKIVDAFLPLAFPIDWHLQYLFQVVQPSRCGWAVDPIFLHGSETSTYNSWQA
jgi:GR25 family glycosyltransferase involved in LPS biosynthesis